MSLRFFSDHCIPTAVSRSLSKEGHQVLLLRDVMPTRSPDAEVIAKAQELECPFVSVNGDFADIVAYPPGAFRGNLAIQLHNHPEVIPRLMERLAAFLRDHPEPAYYQGKLFIVEPHRIRIRQ